MTAGWWILAACDRIYVLFFEFCCLSVSKMGVFSSGVFCSSKCSLFAQTSNSCKFGQWKKGKADQIWCFRKLIFGPHVMENSRLKLTAMCILFRLFFPSDLSKWRKAKSLVHLHFVNKQPQGNTCSFLSQFLEPTVQKKGILLLFLCFSSCTFFLYEPENFGDLGGWVGGACLRCQLQIHETEMIMANHEKELQWKRRIQWAASSPLLFSPPLSSPNSYSAHAPP